MKCILEIADPEKWKKAREQYDRYQHDKRVLGNYYGGGYASDESALEFILDTFTELAELQEKEGGYLIKYPQTREEIFEQIEALDIHDMRKRELKELFKGRS